MGAGPKLELLEEGDQIEASYLGSTYAAPPGDHDGHQKTVVVSQQPQAQTVVQITGPLSPNNCCLIGTECFGFNYVCKNLYYLYERAYMKLNVILRLLLFLRFAIRQRCLVTFYK